MGASGFATSITDNTPKYGCSSAGPKTASIWSPTQITSSTKLGSAATTAGDAGLETSMTCKPLVPSATKAYAPSRTTAVAEPGVSTVPAATGAAGVDTSTMCRPAPPAAT